MLQRGSTVIVEESRMWYREKQTFDELPARTNDEDKHFRQSECEDNDNHDGLTLKSTATYSQIQNRSNISELEQKLVDGLEKLKILDVNLLSEKIQHAEERIKSYREDDQEETKEEMQTLAQLRRMTLLDEEITELKSTRLTEGSRTIMELLQREHELVNELEKLKILDVNVFAEKMQHTEERLKHCREDDREETKKQMQILTQLQQLTLLEEEITVLKSTRLVEDSSSAIKPRRLEHELVSELTEGMTCFPQIPSRVNKKTIGRQRSCHLERAS